MTLTPKIIKTEEDYEAALARIEEIMDAEVGIPEGDELELLSLLVEQYEDRTAPISPPDPISAIRFRMEQAGLKQKDLVPYIGSQSKVSEVLSGQRALSLSMIRNLVNGLGMSAEVLLGQPGAKIETEPPEWTGLNFPFREMWERDYFEGFYGTLNNAKEQKEELLGAFFRPFGTPSTAWQGCALNRQHIRGQEENNECALNAWRVRVITLSTKEALPVYRAELITRDSLQDLVRLSCLDEGPKLAREWLNKRGIALVTEEHLPKTHLDGAALRVGNRAPVVGLTLRYDRLDNFWFTLMHEIAHIHLHFSVKGEDEAFFDDLTQEDTQTFEQEADALASEVLIPQKAWQQAGLNQFSTPAQVCRLAESLRISAAIVAGRVQHETKNFSVLRSLIGSRQVRSFFTSTCR